MPDFPYVISHFKQHKELKNLSLQAIKEQEFPGVNNTHERIHKTDWYVSETIQREYLKILYGPLTDHMSKVFSSIKHDNPIYQTFWATQYKKNHTFAKHHHRQSSWVSIYYLELPKNTPITHFLNVFNEDVFVPNIVEGDIITVPGFVWHWSPVNTSNKTKTVISFNVE